MQYGSFTIPTKKAQGPKVDSNTVITQFEDIANEVDQADEKGSSALSGGASLVETTQEKFRRLGRPYIRMAGIEEGVKYFLVMSPLMSTTLASTPFIETDVTSVFPPGKISNRVLS